MSHANATHPHNSDKEALAEKAVGVKDAVVDLAGEAKKFASHRVSDARDTAAQWVDTANEKVSDANDTVVEYVRRNPFKAIGIAIGIGFVAGILLKRR